MNIRTQALNALRQNDVLRAAELAKEDRPERAIEIDREWDDVRINHFVLSPTPRDCRDKGQIIFGDYTRTTRGGDVWSRISPERALEILFH